MCNIIIDLYKENREPYRPPSMQYIDLHIFLSVSFSLYCGDLQIAKRKRYNLLIYEVAPHRSVPWMMIVWRGNS